MDDQASALSHAQVHITTNKLHDVIKKRPMYKSVFLCFRGGQKRSWPMCPGSQDARPVVNPPRPPRMMRLQRWPTSPDCRRQKAVSSAALCVEPLNCVWDPGNRPIGPYCVMKLLTRAHKHTQRTRKKNLSLLFINLRRNAAPWFVSGGGVIRYWGKVTDPADGSSL